jgi:hypothetical protein
LTIKNGCVKKTGDFPLKIKAEGQWFLNLPAFLRLFTPQLIEYEANSDLNSAYYVLEYLPLPPLNELFVHGKNPLFFWENLFQLISHFFKLCLSHGIKEIEIKEVKTDFNELIGTKTWERISLFISESNYPNKDIPNRINGSLLPSLRQIVEECIRKVDKSNYQIGILHGDLCLSNILFDSRLGRIKLVDPRGLNASGKFSLYGDLRYDLAKLTHSVIGLYDHILAGAYTLVSDVSSNLCSYDLTIYVDERVESIQEAYMKREFIPGIKPLDVMPLTILLFISMLPLHADDLKKQDALLANALRLFNFYMIEKNK